MPARAAPSHRVSIQSAPPAGPVVVLAPSELPIDPTELRESQSVDTANPLVEVAKVLRRTLLVAGVLALGSIVVGLVVGHPFIGLGGAVGVGLGVLNVMGMRSMVARSPAMGNAKRQLAGSSLRRLGLVTAGVFVMLYLDKGMGLATLVGLALFQMLALATTTVPLLRQLRRQEGL